MKQFIPKLSKELFEAKIQIENELRNGNKTNTSQDEFTILQIILEVHKTHKEYEKKGGYTKH